MDGMTRLPFDFSGSAFSPPTSPVTFDFQTETRQVLAPFSWDSSSFGTASLAKDPQLGAVVFGFVATQYGRPRVEYRNRNIYPVSFPNFSSLDQYIAVSRKLFPSSIGDLLRVGTPLDVSISFYRPPPSQGIVFQFTESYTPPVGNLIAFVFGLTDVFRYVFPYGLFSFQTGTALIQNSKRYLYPANFATDGYGTAAVNRTNGCIAQGFTQLAFGQPTLSNKTQYLNVFNFDPRYTQWGTPYVSYKLNQYARPSGVELTGWGSHLIAFFLRYVAQREPYRGSVFGDALVALRVRTITVPWEVYTQYGLPNVSREIVLEPVGFDTSKVGAHKIEWGNVLYPSGWRSSAPLSQEHRVSRSPQVVRVLQRDGASEWGVPFLYNLRQYVYQLYDPDYDKPFNRGFGPYTAILNRNRTVRPVGFKTDAVSYLLFILNTGRAVLPVGLGPEPPQILQIAYRIRSIYPHGRDSLWISRYSAIYNAAYAIYPPSIRSTVVIPKVPLVFSNLQTIKHHSGPTTEWGSAFIADRIRYLFQQISRDYLRAGFPVIGLRVRTLSPTGIAPPAVPPPFMAGPFRKIIQPRWIKGSDKFGYPTLRNKIPQAFARGWDSLDTSFSTGLKHTIDFRVRRLYALGFGVTEIFGRQAISDRRLWIYPIGSDFFKMPITHRIALANPYLPSTRIIIVSGFVLDQNVSFFNKIQSSPFPEGWNSQKFGTAWIRVQGCITRWEWPDSVFGYPSLNPTQYVYGRQAEPFDAWGKPRLSPHTIWCRFDAPAQALRNHGNDRWELIDATPVGSIQTASTYPWWGDVFVSTSPRTIRHYHWDSVYDFTVGGWIGQQTIQLLRRTLSLQGINSARYGYPTLIPHTRKIWSRPWLSLLMGSPTVSTRVSFTRTLPVPGTDFFQLGELRIEHRNRNVYPIGYVATQFGNNEPMVHFPRKVYPNGYIASQFGTQWASFRIRHLYPPGLDSFLCEPSFDSFTGMRIYRVRAGTDGGVRPRSIDSLRVGVPTFLASTQRIYAYQIESPRCLGHDVAVSHAI